MANKNIETNQLLSTAFFKVCFIDYRRLNMEEKVFISAEGLKEVQERLVFLKSVRRKRKIL